MNNRRSPKKMLADSIDLTEATVFLDAGIGVTSSFYLLSEIRGPKNAKMGRFQNYGDLFAIVATRVELTASAMGGRVGP